MAEWTVVQNKKKGKTKSKPINATAPILQYCLFDEISETEAQKKIISHLENFYRTPLFQQLTTRLASFLRNNSSTQNINSFAIGVGRLLQSATAQLQWACFLLIKESILQFVASREDSCISASFTCSEPLFTEQEIQECASRLVQVSTPSDKGLEDRMGSENEMVVLFMPHCPYRSYCNILWTYRHQLDRIIIIGNSFDSYEMRKLGSDKSMDELSDIERLSRSTDTVALLSPFFSEEKLVFESTNLDRKGLSSDVLSLMHLQEIAFCDVSILTLKQDAMELSKDIVVSPTFPSFEMMRQASELDKELL